MMRARDVKAKIKFMLQMVTPPFVYSAGSRLLAQRNSSDIDLSSIANELFGGDDELFKRLVSESIIYGEYGVGASTLWVARNTTAQIIGVDTSLEWAQRVNDAINGICVSSRLFHVDVGPVGDWGMPLSYQKRGAIDVYINGPWSMNGLLPDTVLVDGRFRVACFLSSLLAGRPGTKILFDDYRDRRYYHCVEEFCEVDQMCGRQALFLVPEQVDRVVVSAELERFKYVRD
jgi:hypothetical protein